MKIETETPRVFLHPDGRMDRKNTAIYLGCAPKTLADWAMKGIGPKYVMLGGKAFYFVQDLDDGLPNSRGSEAALAWYRQGRSEC